MFLTFNTVYDRLCKKEKVENMKVYLMRHGQTVWNEIGRAQGRLHNRLSQTGKLQAEEASKRYKNVKIDVIYCSPLMRTIQTANIMNKNHNVKIIKDDRLIELDRGIFTGKLKKKFSPQEQEQYAIHDESCGMETHKKLLVRTKDFVRNVINQNKNKNILIVTHGEVAYCIECLLSRKDLTDFIQNKSDPTPYQNAEVHQVEI